MYFLTISRKKNFGFKLNPSIASYINLYIFQWNVM